MTDITNLVADLLGEHASGLEMVTREDIGSDIIYRKLVKNVREAEKFNYHSDYWGYADHYQEENVEAMRALKPYIGKMIALDGDTGTFIGLLIDKQYNSLGHTQILVD